ncbi:helix-turn-helix domain-containing protein [Streptomyces sp. NRRL S-146]|uniref:helix-turn-helix domain-containing protein n=1 Tax=Streptomyces sp. NRRL S-146 TaxID=1463884 RepID=UPI0004C6B107|nr:helix-turn-helix transcriptional regulator [Streptomyces sp. NRRL S-146]
MNAVRLWVSEEARSYVEEQNPGGLIRIGRTGRGWRLEDLGARIGCSAATVSRLERKGRKADFDLIMSAAKAVEIPTHVLAASLGLTNAPPTRVAPDGPRCAEEDDPMRRRTLLAAAGLAAPASLLAGVSDALASIPDPTGSPVPLDSRLAAARGLFDAGQNSKLLRALPGLLADASHAASPAHEEIALARLSTAYSLASRVLTKVGNYDDSRLAADRATLYAEWSGSPLAAAAAARELSIVLRHQDQPAAAERHILDAVAKVEETGLRTDAQRSAYAQMLCTTSYTAARAGQRDQALTMIREAAHAAHNLPATAPEGRLFPIIPAAVDLYAVGVHWALGDAGAALEAGRGLHEGQFPTAERKGRMHTDLGRAWWQWGKAEQTAAELLSAARVSPGEVRDRPAIRQIVGDLRSHHPQVTGVRELVAAAGMAA